MTWALKEKPKTVRVTRAFAQEIAGMEQIRQDRELSERRLMVYERMLNNGGFRPVTWATCHCKETGTTYRVNGMHTSNLLARQDPMPEFFAIVETYEADTLEDVAHLYSTFDSKMQSRTAADINRSFAAVVPELAALPARTIDVAISAISYSLNQDNYATVPAAERAEKVLDEIEFAQWLNEIFTGADVEKESRFLQRMAVVAAMYLSFKRSRKDATKFWVAVRDQSGERPDLPDRKLAKWLLTNSVANGAGGTASGSRKAPTREFLVRSLHAWNAWRKGAPTDLKYFPANKVPAVV